MVLPIVHLEGEERLALRTVGIRGWLVTDRTVRVALSGEYDIGRAADLRHALLDIDVRGPEVIADLSDVTFMDSSALRALLEVRRALTSEGGTLTIVAVPGPVGVLLDITGTRDLFDVARVEQW